MGGPATILPGNFIVAVWFTKGIACRFFAELAWVFLPHSYTSSNSSVEVFVVLYEFPCEVAKVGLVALGCCLCDDGHDDSNDGELHDETVLPKKNKRTERLNA